MSHPDEHLSFRVGVLDLLHSNDFFLAEDLDGVEPSVVTRFDEVHSTERTGSEAASRFRNEGARREGKRRRRWEDGRVSGREGTRRRKIPILAENVGKEVILTSSQSGNPSKHTSPPSS